MRSRHVSTKLREEVWKKRNGYSDHGQCFVCEVELAKNDMICGHVKSFKDGGETILSNLEPICHRCNICMWTGNLMEFKEDHKDCIAFLRSKILHTGPLKISEIAPFTLVLNVLWRPEMLAAHSRILRGKYAENARQRTLLEHWQAPPKPEPVSKPYEIPVFKITADSTGKASQIVQVDTLRGESFPHKN
jgi:hypothetical protein